MDAEAVTKESENRKSRSVLNDERANDVTFSGTMVPTNISYMKNHILDRRVLCVYGCNKAGEPTNP
ncbi:hypothetical protein YC2023_001687 [Brassica napus]